MRLWLALPLAATLCTACALVLGIDERPPYPDTTDAGDAGSAGDATAFDPCGPSTAFPPRPGDAVGGPVLDFVVRHPGFQGLPSDGGTPQVCEFGSLNLDGLDTCNGKAGSAASACVPRADIVCDLGEGRDDALGALISRLPDGAGLDARIENGEFGLMIGLSGYSGGADDGNVVVDFFVLGPLEAKAADAGPTWTGDDTWSMDKTSCPADNCSLVSKYRGEGYVAGGVLWARVPSFSFPITVGGARTIVPVEDAIVTGVLHPGAQLILTHGRVAGRVPRDPTLREVARAPFFGNSFCESKSWPFVLKIACDQADLPREAGASMATCDAFSVGITFEGWRAARGKPIAIDAGGDCPDASFDCP